MQKLLMRGDRTSQFANEEIFMTLKIISATMPVFLVISAIASADVPNEKISALVTLCEVNPNCSHEPANAAGGVLFNIHNENQVKHITCQNDGSCMMIMPRGKRFLISDVIAQLAPN
jgi:hypothetical protein